MCNPIQFEFQDIKQLLFRINVVSNKSVSYMLKKNIIQLNWYEIQSAQGEKS